MGFNGHWSWEERWRFYRLGRSSLGERGPRCNRGAACGTLRAVSSWSCFGKYRTPLNPSLYSFRRSKRARKRPPCSSQSVSESVDFADFVLCPFVSYSSPPPTMHAAQRAPSLSRSFCTCRPLLVSPRPKPTTASPKPSPRYIKPRALSPTGPQTGLFVSTASIPAIVHRPMLINEEAAGDLVRAWGLDKMHDVTVVEAYAGEWGRGRGGEGS